MPLGTLRTLGKPATRVVRTVGVSCALGLALLGAACSLAPPAEDRNYASDLAATRTAKDADLLNSPDIVPKNRRTELLPLAYFPIEQSYSVPAALKPATDRQTMEMPTSTGLRRQMRRVGRLEFSLKGQPMQLTAFVEVGAPNLDRLFVPFMDLTSGTETYPAGRYLDLDRNATGVYVIDFNRAYHPYCYYNPSYDCPYPPPENRLSVPVRAGERLKHPNT